MCDTWIARNWSVYLFTKSEKLSAAIVLQTIGFLFIWLWYQGIIISTNFLSNFKSTKNMMRIAFHISNNLKCVELLYDKQSKSISISGKCNLYFATWNTYDTTLSKQFYSSRQQRVWMRLTVYRNALIYLFTNHFIKNIHSGTNKLYFYQA